MIKETPKPIGRSFRGSIPTANAPGAPAVQPTATGVRQSDAHEARDEVTRRAQSAPNAPAQLDEKTQAVLDKQEAHKREVLRQNLMPSVPAAGAEEERRIADGSRQPAPEDVASTGTGLTTHEPAAVAAGFMRPEDYREEREEAFRIGGAPKEGRLGPDPQRPRHSGEVGPKPGERDPDDRKLKPL